MGADLNRVDVLKSVRLPDGKRYTVSLQRDLKAIAQQVRQRGYALIIIIDPIDAYLGKGKDSFKYADMRSVLDSLAEFAERNRVTLLAIQHLTKGQRDKAIYRGQSSIAFLATARSVLFLGTDPEDVQMIVEFRAVPPQHLCYLSSVIDHLLVLS